MEDSSADTPSANVFDILSLVPFSPAQRLRSFMSHACRDAGGGVSAAVANAIHNATGVRVRDYPITLDKLLKELPEVG